jgi:hypothetical protein
MTSEAPVYFISGPVYLISGLVVYFSIRPGGHGVNRGSAERLLRPAIGPALDRIGHPAAYCFKYCSAVRRVIDEVGSRNAPRYRIIRGGIECAEQRVQFPC